MASDTGPDTISYFCFGYRTGARLCEYQVDKRLAGTWEKAEARLRAYAPEASVEYREERSE